MIEDAEERAGAAATEEEAGAARAERKALVGRLCKQMELIEDEGAVDEEIETSGGETSLMLAAAAGNPQVRSLPLMRWLVLLCCCQASALLL